MRLCDSPDPGDQELEELLTWYCNLSPAKKHMLNQAKNIKINPNEKCPCGSGKKYKKCCQMF